MKLNKVFTIQTLENGLKSFEFPNIQRAYVWFERHVNEVNVLSGDCRYYVNCESSATCVMR